MFGKHRAIEEKRVESRKRGRESFIESFTLEQIFHLSPIAPRLSIPQYFFKGGAGLKYWSTKNSTSSPLFFGEFTP